MESRGILSVLRHLWASLAEDLVNERQSPSDPIVASKCLRSMGRPLPISLPMSEIDQKEVVAGKCCALFANASRAYLGRRL